MLTVYFLLQKKPPLVKIGIARSVDDRVATLRTGNPNGLELLGVMPGSFSLEATLHEALAQWRVEGEWFRYAAPVKVFINDCLTQGHSSALAQHCDWLAQQAVSAGAKPRDVKPVVPVEPIGSLREFERLLRGCGFSKSVSKRLAAHGWADRRAESQRLTADELLGYLFAPQDTSVHCEIHEMASDLRAFLSSRKVPC